MKQQTKLFSALLILQGFAPVGYLLAKVLGMEFLVNSELPFFLGLTILTLTFTVQLKLPRTPTMLALVLYPLAILNGLICLGITRSLMGVPCVAVQVLCCRTLFREFAPRNISRKLVGLGSVLLVLALVAMSAIIGFAGIMSKVTVVQEVDSPFGTYTAQLIDADYGATGGDTLVKVWDNDRTVNLWLVRFTPKANEIYRGRWGEFQDMTLSWQDDATLLINEKAYPMG